MESNHIDKITNVIRSMFGHVDNPAQIPTNVVGRYISSMVATVISYENAMDIARQIIDNLYSDMYEDDEYKNDILINQKAREIQQIFTHENIERLTDLLRHNRYIIYLVQYDKIVKGEVTQEGNTWIEDIARYADTEIDRMSELYFNITSYYSVEMLVQLFNGQLESAYDITYLFIKHLDIVQSLISNIELMTKDRDPELIKRTYLDFHGGVTNKLVRVPDNKVVVIVTPYNRKGIIKYTDYHINLFSRLLHTMNIFTFIKEYTCFIEQIFGPGGEKDCSLAGMQVYYPGQYYFDMTVSKSADDPETMGIYEYSDFDNAFNLMDGNDCKTILSNLIPDDNMAEIIVFNACRSATSSLEPYMVELVYRYNKIHDIITDEVCSCTVPGKAVTMHGAQVSCKSDYASVFPKIPVQASNIQDRSLMINKQLTPVRNKAQLVIGNELDILYKQPFGETSKVIIEKYKDMIDIYDIAIYANVDLEEKMLYMHNLEPTTKITYTDSIIIIYHIVRGLDINNPARITETWEMVQAPSVFLAKLPELYDSKGEQVFANQSYLLKSLVSLSKLIDKLDKGSVLLSQVNDIFMYLARIDFQCEGLRYGEYIRLIGTMIGKLPNKEIANKMFTNVKQFSVLDKDDLPDLGYNLLLDGITVLHAKFAESEDYMHSYYDIIDSKDNVLLLDIYVYLHDIMVSQVVDSEDNSAATLARQQQNSQLLRLVKYGYDVIKYRISKQSRKSYFKLDAYMLTLILGLNLFPQPVIALLMEIYEFLSKLNMRHFVVALVGVGNLYTDLHVPLVSDYFNKIDYNPAVDESNASTYVYLVHDDTKLLLNTLSAVRKYIPSWLNMITYLESRHDTYINSNSSRPVFKRIAGNTA